MDESSAQYAIKLERSSKMGRRTPSEHEANVLRILADASVSPRIPRVVDYGYDKPSHSKALVLDLLGADIQPTRKKCGGYLTSSHLYASPSACVYSSESPISFFSHSYNSVYPLQRLHPQRYKTRKRAFGI